MNKKNCNLNRSRSKSPVQIPSQSFLNKKTCENNLKKDVVYEALKLGISLEDDCGKKKVIKTLCDEIEKIKSKKCSNRSKNFSEPFLVKPQCHTNLKKDVVNEALRFGIEIKDECGDEKTVKTLCEEMENRINSKKFSVKSKNKTFSEYLDNKYEDINSKNVIYESLLKLKIPGLEYANNTNDKLAKNTNEKIKKLCKKIELEIESFSLPKSKKKSNNCYTNCIICRNCEDAAENGHVECLEHFHKIFRNMSFRVGLKAIKYRNLNCLKYFYQNIDDYQKEEALCIAAAKYGNLDSLEYLHKNGTEITYNTTDTAAEFGNLNCLEYLHNNGFDWSSMTTQMAAYNGHLDCLKYAVKNGCKFDKEYCLKIAQDENIINYINKLLSKNKKKC
jgi:hypothetical protein